MSTDTTASQKKPQFRISSVKIGVEIADKEYGDGNSGYASISGYVDDARLDQIDDVIDAGLDLFVAAWQTIIAGKVATKLLSMSAQEVQDTVTAIQKRVAKVRTLLRDGKKTA